MASLFSLTVSDSHVCAQVCAWLCAYICENVCVPTYECTGVYVNYFVNPATGQGRDTFLHKNIVGLRNQ